ncbi:MAG TPA: hypothetical protein DCE56_03350 [Cyanobacteria bacterium UBA8553]|nr:hypothetical protein [Cyanobacteria bacterium UBA8553]
MLLFGEVLSELPDVCDFSEVPDVDDSFFVVEDFVPSEVPDIDESFSWVEDFSVPLEDDESLVVPGVLKSSAPLGEGDSCEPPGVCNPSELPGVDELSGSDVPLGGDSTLPAPPGVPPGVDSPLGFSPLEQAPRSNTSPKTIDIAVS